MLSDKEKQTIEYLKARLYGNEGCKIIDVAQSDLRIFLNLIEKQSKEIEELSDKLTEKICKGVEEEILEEYRQTIISKDKEIEELKAINEKVKELGWLDE